MCVLVFSTDLSEISLILRTEQKIGINMQAPSLKVPVIIVRCNETRILSTNFRKIHKYQI